MTTPSPVAPGPASPASPPESPFRRWWSGLGRGQRLVAVVVAAVVALNVSMMGVEYAVGGGDPGGPVSSSLSTGADGMEAFADLVESFGHPVRSLTETVDPEDLPAGATVVVADPEQMSEAEAMAIIETASRGGRLVLAGPGTAPLLEAASGAGLEPSRREPQELLSVSPDADGVAMVAGSARELAGDTGWRWHPASEAAQGAGGGGAPVRVHAVDGDDRAVLVSAPLGSGEVVALAESAVLQNQNLARADNAALALALAGGEGRTVVFVESVHGFDGKGMAAVPAAWRWTAAGLALAFLLGLWWTGSRFGPPEPEGVTQRPARMDHVRAVAAGVERAGADLTEVVEPLQRAGRRRLTETLNLAPDSSPVVIASAARHVGVAPEVVDLMVDPPADLAAALAVGEVAARQRQVTMGTPTPIPSPDLDPRSPVV